MKKLFVALYCLMLSGCFVESVLVTSTVISGADLYYTLNKEEAKINIKACGGLEKITYKKQEFAQLTDAMQIQLLIHNQRYACECEHNQAACEDI